MKKPIKYYDACCAIRSQSAAAIKWEMENPSAQPYHDHTNEWSEEHKAATVIARHHTMAFQEFIIEKQIAFAGRNDKNEIEFNVSAEMRQHYSYPPDGRNILSINQLYNLFLSEIGESCWHTLPYYENEKA